MFTNEELERHGFHIMKPGEDLVEEVNGDDDDSESSDDNDD